MISVVALDYLIELDFVCIVRAGELLDLSGSATSSPSSSPAIESRGKGLPFVRMNGPLLVRCRGRLRISVVYAGEGYGCGHLGCVSHFAT